MINWTVTAPQGGRRRAGRRWDEGHTPVPPEEQSDALWDAIRSDPMMHIAQDTSGDPMPVPVSGFIRPGDASVVEGPVDRIGAPRAVVADRVAPAAAEVPSIEEVVRGLKAEDYTAGGKPKTEAIEAAIEVRGGGKVTISAAERDAAWTALLATGFAMPVATV